MTSHTSFARAYTHTLTAPCAAYMTHVAASAPTPAALALARAASTTAVTTAHAASALAQHALMTFNVTMAPIAPLRPRTLGNAYSALAAMPSTPSGNDAYDTRLAHATNATLSANQALMSARVVR